MKRDKIVKTVIIITTILVAISIIVGIVYILKTGKSYGNGKKLKSDKIEIAENCVFDVSLRNFNRLANNVSAIKLCEGYNKLIIKDVTLNEEKISLHAVYFNGSLETNNKNLRISAIYKANIFMC